MKLKYKVLIIVVITAIIMFPVSKITNTAYHTLFLTSLMLETAATVYVVFKNIDKPLEYE